MADSLDLSSFDTPDAADSVLDELREQAARAQEVRERSAGLVGEARNESGHVTARYTGQDGLQRLELDPRAMRLPSADLAGEIVAVTAAARADLARQRAELAAEAGLLPPLDPERARGQLAELQAEFRRNAGDVQTLVDRFRADLGR